jgi:hypothetical protein
MKKSFLILVIAGFLVLGLSEVQAQTTQPKPNQVELFKKLIGNWKVDMAKDTVLYVDYKAFGSGAEGNDKTLAKDKMIGEEKELWGYDSKLDKFVGADFVKGKDIEIWVIWFTSNTKFESVHFSDISNPDKASIRAEGEFKSPDAYSASEFINGKVVLTYNVKRVK